MVMVPVSLVVVASWREDVPLCGCGWPGPCPKSSWDSEFLIFASPSSRDGVSCGEHPSG